MKLVIKLEFQGVNSVYGIGQGVNSVYGIKRRQKANLMRQKASKKKLGYVLPPI